MSESCRARLRLLIPVALILCVSPPALGAITQRGQERQPRNIYELVYSFQHTFARILTGEEMALFRTHTPLQLKESYPRLYARISADVVGWTDEWLLHLKATVGPIPEKKLNAAKQAARQVDAVLRAHFEGRDWPYRPMRVVFLPPRLFLDERDRGSLTSGMFIPYYPDAFFASIDWPVPMEMLLTHESLHFNALHDPFGSRFEEGLAETAARHLVVKYGLLTAREVWRREIYPIERKGVDLLIEVIMKRRAVDRDGAIDLLLEAYVTGRQEQMTEIFGADVWKKILDLSPRYGTWQTHSIEEVLGE